MTLENASKSKRRGRTIEVPGNGSCLFHSVFIAYRALMTQRPPEGITAGPLVAASAKLRNAAVDYIIDHYRKPLGGIKGNMRGCDLVLLEYASDDHDGEENVRGPMTYARKMMDVTTFGGNTELHALSALLDVAIVVHQTAGTPQTVDTLGCSGKRRRRTIELLLESQHYRPIRRD
jgi:hypothetical protein